LNWDVSFPQLNRGELTFDAPHLADIWTRFLSRFDEASVGRMLGATTCGGLFPSRTKDGGESSLQFEFDCSLNHQIVDQLERLGREPSEAAAERIVSRNRQTIEVGELAQRASIGNPLAQFAIVSVLDAHENQRAQDLLRRHAAATSA
jgi:hypothetical protein